METRHGSMIATPTYALPAPQDIEPAPLLKVSFYCFCIFNLAYYSRFFEWQLWYLHVPLVTSCIALLGAAMEGKLLMTLGSKIGMCMAALTALYAVNIPLSSWKAGSFQTFTQDWLKSVTVFLIAGALVTNVRHCRTALNSIGFGSGMGAVLVNWKGQIIDGRLVMGRGTFGNSNEIAFDILLGLPFLTLIVLDGKSGKLKRLLAFCLLGNSVFTLVRTGSRTGIIGFAVLCFLLFLRTSVAGKSAMAFVAMLFLASVITIFPNSLKERYLSIIVGSEVREMAQNNAEARQLDMAVSSSAARRQLMINAIKVSISHPIFGVGIGEFGTYMTGVEKLEGRRSGWQGTHNTYLQISSEAGTPALILFLIMMWLSFKGLRRLYKRADRIAAPESREIAQMAFALDASLVAYAVCVFFDFVAYSATLPVLAGFTIALVQTGKTALDTLERRANQAPQVQLVNWMPVNPARRWVRPSGVGSSGVSPSGVGPGGAGPNRPRPNGPLH
jgi:O-antigen ligase